jgi:hypothetical protein
VTPVWCAYFSSNGKFAIEPPVPTSGTFTVSFNLDDSTQLVPYKFDIIVLSNTANNPPYFSPALSTQTVTVGGTLNYNLPSIMDPETDVCTIANLVKPAWCGYDPIGKIFAMAPPLGTTGTFTVTFDLTDSNNTVPSTFQIVVQAAPVNNPPSFSPALSTQTVTVGGTPVVYNLPSIVDPESDACTISNVVNPASWCTYDAGAKSFTLSPPLGIAI